MSSTTKLIQKSILAPLAKTAWSHDAFSLHKFGTLLQHHAEADLTDGATCCYHLSDDKEVSNTITACELRAIVNEGAIQPNMHYGDAVNQHWLHSLEQFYAEVTVAWQAHQQRTDALAGTPAGRIAK
ncbi:MAG: hypothetical protein M0038_05290 [Pseudomonadota bacterium]|jgi:hypothetical protein|nr:hypothetical protein [Pseudomonadota bacterium]